MSLTLNLCSFTTLWAMPVTSRPWLALSTKSVPPAFLPSGLIRLQHSGKRELERQKLYAGASPRVFQPGEAVPLEFQSPPKADTWTEMQLLMPIWAIAIVLTVAAILAIGFLWMVWVVVRRYCCSGDDDDDEEEQVQQVDARRNFACCVCCH
jgi:hypothetical protein